MSEAAIANNVLMSDRTFSKFSSFIEAELGIKMPVAKKTMLQSRLLKRMRKLNIESFNAYYDYVFASKGKVEELTNMVDVVTTNKTDFFREPRQFEYLLQTGLHDLIDNYDGVLSRPLMFWSAGCSTGEEPYTLAMVLAEFFGRKETWNFSILATDISTRVLAKAREGIYSEDVVGPVPAMWRQKYLLRGKGWQKGFYRVVPELRNRIIFKQINLNNGENFGIQTRMDGIFCRNVIIYFDRETQIKLFSKFYSQLIPGGYMFIGHSETLHGINDRFRPAGSSLYRKPV